MDEPRLQLWELIMRGGGAIHQAQLHVFPLYPGGLAQCGTGGKAQRGIGTLATNLILWIPVGALAYVVYRELYRASLGAGEAE